MATCKKCIHSKKCFNNGNTRYYGETIACDNVETLCEWFISTDDVVEVRRGEWIMRGGRFRCSKCDAKALWRDTGGTGGFSHEYEQVRSDFCYACGADLRGNTNDNRTEN